MPTREGPPDDPILDAVLSAPEGFAYAEERRLFYVALTRARHGVHLIADYALPSLFIAELLTYAREIQAHGNAARISVPCPACRGGTLVNRSGQRGTFIACSNYPHCTYTTKPCPKCGVGVLLRGTPESYVCNKEGCGTRQRACPRCDDGRFHRTSRDARRCTRAGSATTAQRPHTPTVLISFPDAHC